ncbi:MAG: DUF3667 domain-containing protein [Pseudomonadota bacterium]|nr:DUF3667 domain-containing protein [Pseudomonadota bacterium]
MSHPAARTDVACRNCGTQAPLKFCPECGQETTLHPPTLGEFLHEFVGHYVALEGTLWRTLALLLRKPGRLTREYLDGRRRRYVLPLRLYLTASFLFFLVLKLTAGSVDPAMVVKVDGHPMPLAEYKARAASAAAAPPPGAASMAPLPKFEMTHLSDCGGTGRPACNRVQAYSNTLLDRFQANPQESVEHMRTHFLGLAPYAIFVMLPAFAGIMMLAYRRRRMTYGEHFVFSLHLHAFWFLALMVNQLVPDSLGSVLQLAVPVYGVWAMREAYGGGWGATIVRALLVTLLYCIVLLAASVALTLGLLATS